MSRPLCASRHQRRRRLGRTRPYRGAVGYRDKGRVMTQFPVATRVVTTHFPVVTRCLWRLPFPSRWDCDGLGGCDNIWSSSGVSVVAVGVSACAPGQSCP
ncbi:hypothetical protein Taro_051497 [Colocasia esculenta]|uniref:Uncharacterized protein n=1 Tax=Colocasia esculenta TaxID=4460 RepID=A0A843XGY3_COLES|nr:hypothetical protein [Colocasia esculenta]